VSSPLPPRRSLSPFVLFLQLNLPLFFFACSWSGPPPSPRSPISRQGECRSAGPGSAVRTLPSVSRPSPSHSSGSRVRLSTGYAFPLLSPPPFPHRTHILLGIVDLIALLFPSVLQSAIQVRHAALGVQSLAVLKDGSYVNLPRQDYNYFLASSGLGPGPYSVRPHLSRFASSLFPLSPRSSLSRLGAYSIDHFRRESRSRSPSKTAP
jgi:hypothetical protein